MGRWHRQPAPSVKPSDVTRPPTLRRTAALNSPNAEQPTEEQLDEAKALGDEQQELKQLTQELTAKARAGP